MSYLGCKWIHIVAIISWMAGLLYLFRLLIYHQLKGPTSRDNHELLQIMERKLFRIITIPAMVVSWIFGIGMLYLQPSLLQGTWLHVKLLCVVGLTGLTFYAGALHNRFAKAHLHSPTQKQLRLLNEVPTLLMFIIVGLVVFKPW